MASAVTMGQFGKDSMILQRQNQHYEDQKQHIIDMQQDFQDKITHKLEQHNEMEQNRMQQAKRSMEVGIK